MKIKMATLQMEQVRLQLISYPRHCLLNISSFQPKEQFCVNEVRKVFIELYYDIGQLVELLLIVLVGLITKKEQV